MRNDFPESVIQLSNSRAKTTMAGRVKDNSKTAMMLLLSFCSEPLAITVRKKSESHD